MSEQVIKRNEQVIDLVQKHRDNKIKEVRFIDYYAEPQKQKEFQVIFGDGTQNTPALETLLKGLIAVLENKARLVLKNEPKYRAWTADEVPEYFQIRYKRREEIKFFGKGERTLDELLQHYEYRTNLLEDKWHVCGVEVSDE